MSDVEVIKPSIYTKHIQNTIFKKAKKKVCAYCRVSTDAEEQKTSYYSQIQYYTNLIKKNKDWEYVGVYADEGITGTQIKKRDEFIRMIDDCKAGCIDIVIAKSISRFARNTVDTLNTVRLLRSLDIDVYFEKENIHTLNMDSEMFLTLYSAFAQAESESTSQNVKMGYRAKMKRGEPCGQANCFGYIWDKENKKLVINNDEAKIVKKIFKYYLEGYGSSRIARKLMDEGIPAPGGGIRWHPSPIKDILRNVKYVGDLCGQKYFVESPLSHKEIRNKGQKEMYYKKNNHEAIISREVFDKVQDIYNKRSTIIKEGKVYCEKFSMKYTFSSMIFCGECGKCYVRRVSNHTNKDGITHTHVYWTCSSLAQTNTEKCKHVTSIRDDEIKSLFVSLFNKFIISKNNDDLLKAVKSTTSKENIEDKLESLKRKQNEIKDKINNLIDLNLNQNIDRDVFTQKNNEFNNELKMIQDEIDNIYKDQKKRRTEERRIKELENEINGMPSMTKFDDMTFKKLVSKIIIGEYDSNNNFIPNVVKFVLKVKGNSNDNEVKYLSLEIDERHFKA